MKPFFERPTVKNLAITAMAFLLGLAVGNGWATHEAMQGQAAWWQGKVRREVATARRQEYGSAMEFCMELLREPSKLK